MTTNSWFWHVMAFGKFLCSNKFLASTLIIPFVRSNNHILWAIRDCMSSQQLVDFIREHINTVSTKLFNSISPSEKRKTILVCLALWQYSWKEVTKCRRKAFLQYVNECLIDAWLHQPWAARDVITWPWSWCSSRSWLLSTRTPVVHNNQLETRDAPRPSKSPLIMLTAVVFLHYRSFFLPFHGR